jgi:hypothetical protein
MAAEIRTEARVIDIQVSNARIEAAMARLEARNGLALIDSASYIPL